MASIFSPPAGLALLLAISGSAANGMIAPAAEVLDPIEFFTGRTRGAGELDTLVSSPVKLSVESIGRRQGDVLVLDQTIREGSKPPRVRRWTMQRIAPNAYTGSLTDAQGPVRVIVNGPSAFIRYKMKNGLKVDQKLTLQSDRRTLLNRLEVEKFGVRVASVEETIRKLD